MPDKVRLGFVGAGYMGQKAHLDNFVTIPECEIVALAEGRKTTAEMVARKYGIPKVYPNHRAMLEAEELDAVVAIMGYALHHAVVPAILQAGKHVLTEKPICVRPDTARGLAELAQKRGVIYYVGYNKRSLSATQWAVQELRAWQVSGQFGKMKYVRACMPPGNWTYDIEAPLRGDDPPASYEDETPEAMPDWLDEPTQKVYNSFVNYYIHQVNLIRYLLGEDYHVTYADRSRALLVGVSDSGIPVTLEMQGYGLRNGWEESYRVVFEEAKMDLSVPAPMARQRSGEVQVFRGKDVQRFEQPVLPPHWSFLEQARHFVRCVRGEEEPWAPVRDAVKDLEVADEYARMLI